MSEKNVLIKNYTAIQGKFLPSYPLVEIQLWIDEKMKTVAALVDTGYDGTLLLSNNVAKKIKLDKKYLIQDDSYDIEVANGNTIEAFRYRTTIGFGNIKGPLEFSVVGEDVELIWDAILGRAALYRYGLLFDERTNPKKLTITT